MRDQLSAGQKYIDTHENMIPIDTYIDDGISGQKLKRDDFQRLLDDIRAGQIDLVIFTRLDRWFRNLRHYLNTQGILDRHGVSWTAIEQPYFDTSTPHGRVFVNNSTSDIPSRTNTSRQMTMPQPYTTHPILYSNYTHER